MTISKRTSYQKVKAAVADPTEQVAILLEYVAKEIIRAEFDLDDGKYEQFSIHVDKSLSVINGLTAVLQDQDDVSGEVASFVNDMTGFYAGLIMKISRLNKENYKQICPIIVADAQAMAKLWRDSKGQAVDTADIPEKDLPTEKRQQREREQPSAEMTF